MAYVKAVAMALAAAIVLGGATGLGFAVWGVFQALRPEDKATVLSRAISEGLNCAAFFTLVLIPLLVAFVFVRRRLRSRP
jgi:hypothetical protein